MTPDPPIPHLVGADKCRLNGALTTLPATSLPHGPIASQPHRTQHDQRRGFAVEHRDPPIPETVPPKVPGWPLPCRRPRRRDRRNDVFEPVGMAWTLRCV